MGDWEGEELYGLVVIGKCQIGLNADDIRSSIIGEPDPRLEQSGNRTIMVANAFLQSALTESDDVLSCSDAGSQG